MRIYEILSNEPVMLYHLTDNARFKLNPNFEPQDNAISITDRSGNKGIYLTTKSGVENWVNGKHYWRPFVAEIAVEPSAMEHDRISRWGAETFIPADQFDKLKVVRVVPIDAICREEYGTHGWIEACHGDEFDTHKPITAKDWERPYGSGYTYSGDTRHMSADNIKYLKKHFRVGLQNRLRG